MFVGKSRLIEVVIGISLLSQPTLYCFAFSHN